MILDGKPKGSEPAQPQSAQPKRRSIVREMFNPHFGDSIRPLGESYNTLVQLIAFVFAAQGLFPREHPALNGAKDVKLRLQDVIGTAWGRLSFTREGLPKVLVFFAVVGSIVLSIVGLITAFMTLFVGKAHAQSNFFTVPDATHDIGYNLIEYLFNPTGAAGAAAPGNLNTLYQTALGNNQAQMPSINTQTALYTALGFYSNAMLIFAAIILFYHLASMVVDTAHSGVTMGRRANQIWAPIRLVAAIALLVPIASGLNSGQYIVVKMAELGSNLASQVWTNYVQNIIGNAAKFAIPSPASVAEVVTTMATNSACEYAYNYQMAKLATNVDMSSQFVDGWTNPGGPVNGNVSWNINGTPTDGILPEPLPDGSIRFHLQALQPILTDTDICGSITMPAAPIYKDPTTQNIAMGIYNAQLQAYNNAKPQFMDFGGKTMANCCITDLTDSSGGSGLINLKTNVTPIGTIIDQYQAALINGIVAAVTSSPKMTDNLTGTGWIGAGGFFNQLAQIQTNIDSVARNIPKAGAAQLTNLAIQYNTSPYVPVDNQLTQFKNYTNASFAFVGASPVGNTVPSTVSGAQPTANEASIWHNLSWTNYVEDIFAIADSFASREGVWTQTAGNTFNTGVQFSGAWPLAQIADYGQRNVQAGFGIMNFALKLIVGGNIGSFLPVVGGIGKAAAALGAAIIPIGGIFFALGFLLGVVLPLIPFMHFFFGTISWLAVLFEAVIAMPLVAIAHITPEGEGLPGPMAKGAYSMVFSLLLRPVLMIFGLIAGFLILGLSVTILNLLFSTAVQATGTAGALAASGYTVFVRLAYTIIYCTIILSVANHAFQLITHIPNQIMTWMGGQNLAGPRMGDPDKIEQYATFAAGYMGTKGIGAVASGVNQGLGSLRKPLPQDVRLVGGGDGGGGGSGGGGGEIGDGSPGPAIPSPSSGAGGAPVSTSSDVGSALRDTGRGGQSGGGNRSQFVKGWGADEGLMEQNEENAAGNLERQEENTAGQTVRDEEAAAGKISLDTNIGGSLKDRNKT